MPGVRPKLVFWKPGMVVRGQRVYLDANFLVALAWPDHIWHTQASALLAALSERKTGLVVSSLALNEAIYQLLQLDKKAGPVNNATPPANTVDDEPDDDYENDFYDDYEDDEDLDETYRPPRRPARPPAPAPVIRSWAERLSQVVGDLPNLRSFEPPNAEFHRQVILAVRDLNLDPTDAFHYSAARQLACPLVTNDAGFQKIPDQNLVVVTFF